MARRSKPLAALAAGTLLAAGCGQEDPSPPAACTDGAGPVLVALRQAPAPVRLGTVPISRCVSSASEAEELQAVGAGLVEAASRLSATARTRPESAAALRLGYLLGAARRGAGDNQGERSELLRRLEQERASVPRSSGAVRRGFAAGQRDG